MKIKYLQVLVMPNDEILCEGKTVGFAKNLGKYLIEENRVMKYLRDGKKRLFFVVWGKDINNDESGEINREIFETLEEADEYITENKLDTFHTHIAVSIVKNAYREDDGKWNYEDLSDTFQDIYNLQ